MIEPSALLGILSPVVIAIVGWLLSRSINGIDAGMKGLAGKVDALAGQDTAILIELASLRTRVTSLEYLVHRDGPHAPPVTR